MSRSTAEISWASLAPPAISVSARPWRSPSIDSTRPRSVAAASATAARCACAAAIASLRVRCAPSCRFLHRVRGLRLGITKDLSGSGLRRVEDSLHLCGRRGANGFALPRLGVELGYRDRDRAQVRVDRGRLIPSARNREVSLLDRGPIQIHGAHARRSA